jgi:hypothetical protein
MNVGATCACTGAPSLFQPEQITWGTVMGSLFRTFGPMMAFDKMDPDLAGLGDSASYLPATGAG